ncbi:MAG: hypothetical protein ACRDRK_12120 [Pseudonocardia sp.]
MHDQTIDEARYVKPHELCCGSCRDEVADGPEGFTHRDGSQLCTGEPVEVAR